jgi:hypothetical protein
VIFSLISIKLHTIQHRKSFSCAVKCSFKLEWCLFITGYTWSFHSDHSLCLDPMVDIPVSQSFVQWKQDTYSETDLWQSFHICASICVPPTKLPYTLFCFHLNEDHMLLILVCCLHILSLSFIIFLSSITWTI